MISNHTVLPCAPPGAAPNVPGTYRSSVRTSQRCGTRPREASVQLFLHNSAAEAEECVVVGDVERLGGGG
jgi:hypothetical protein